MGLLSRSRTYDQQGNGRVEDITAGSCVVVLNGRHFPAFGAGDEGVVLRVDPEAQNCEVLFHGKSQAVPVALRHLRALSSSKAASASFDAPAAAPAEPVAEGSPWQSFTMTSSWQRTQHQQQSDALDPSVAPAWPSQAVHPPAEARALFVRGAMVAADLNNDARPDVIVEGPDVSRGGAAMSGTSPSAAAVPPVQPPVLPPSERPIVVQQCPGSARGLGGYSASCPVAPPGRPLEARAPRLSCQLATANGIAGSPGSARWSNGAAAAVASPGRVVASCAGAGGRSDLEAIEARVACIEEEHRLEVAALRHALEECIVAISSSAQAIDGYCAEGANGGCSHAAAGASSLRDAAASLHQAAALGMRALGPASVRVPVQVAAGSSSQTSTPSLHQRGRAVAHTAGSWSSTAQPAAALGMRALGTTASVAVVDQGARAPVQGAAGSSSQTATPSLHQRGRAVAHSAGSWSSAAQPAEAAASRRARSGSPGSGMLGASHRRLVACASSDVASCAAGLAQPLRPVGVPMLFSPEDSPARGSLAQSGGASLRAMSAGACGCRGGALQPVSYLAPVQLGSPPQVMSLSAPVCSSGSPAVASGLLQPPGILGGLGQPPMGLPAGGTFSFGSPSAGPPLPLFGAPAM